MRREVRLDKLNRTNSGVFFILEGPDGTSVRGYLDPAKEGTPDFETIYELVIRPAEREDSDS